MNVRAIFVINCSFNVFLKLSLEPFLEITCAVINIMYGLSDTHGWIVCLACAQGHETPSLKPQTKSLKFIFTWNSKAWRMNLKWGATSMIKNPVEEWDWVFISRMGKYKPRKFVWRGPKLASLVYGTNWNSSNTRESRRSFMCETVTAKMFTVCGRVSWLYPYESHGTFPLHPTITVVISTNTKLCSVRQADEYETIWWLVHP